MFSKANKITVELDELVNFHEQGGGFGDPDAVKEHERKIELLKHKQIQEISKSNNRIAVFNIAIALVNVGILIYQVFFTN